MLEREPAFATAPPWFRPVLRAERLALVQAYRYTRRAREAARIPAGAGTSNVATNVLGNQIPERAVPGHVPGWVMGQHVARYAWAMAACSEKAVVEFGAGDGYGSNLLSWVANSVVGLDIDPPAIAAARERYPKVTFQEADVTHTELLPPGDVAIAFEVLEHVTDPTAVLSAALTQYPRVLLSFPNPIYHGSHLNPHHRQDWPLSHLRRVLRAAGAERVRAFHQTRRGSEVRRGALPWSSIWIIDAQRG